MVVFSTHHSEYRRWSSDGIAEALREPVTLASQAHGPGRTLAHAWVARSVRSAIAERLGVEPSAVRTGDLMAEELGLHPLDLVLIVAAVEGIDAAPFPADALASARTVGDLIDALHAVLFRSVSGTGSRAEVDRAHGTAFDGPEPECQRRCGSMDDGELAKVRAENERLTTLLDAVSDVLLLVDVDDVQLYANRAAREQLSELTGLSGSEVSGNVKLRWAFPPDLVRSIDEAKGRARASGFVAEEILLPLASGARWYEHKLTAVRGEDGECRAFAVTSRDIHERVLAREELAGALAFREQIIGILGHDMRNPLSAISALATLTLRRSDVPADVRGRLEQMELAALRTLEMIETLLDFTESRFRKTFKIARVRTDVHSICRAVVAEISAAEPHRAIELSTHGDGHADCDPARIAQVVSNLVVNALTHGDKSESVRLVIDGHQDHVVIAVTNRGTPITEGLMGVLFEPFRRRPDALDRPRGLGLGLYIAQQIVSAHGGKITVSSSGDAGTCFRISLPRRDPGISGPVGAF